MNKFMIFLCALATTCFSGYAKQEERAYIEPESIYIAPNGIFLNMEGELYGITALNVDEEGIYIPTPTAGYCGKHGYYPGNSTICPKCMAEKKRKK